MIATSVHVKRTRNELLAEIDELNSRVDSFRNDYYVMRSMYDDLQREFDALASRSASDTASYRSNVCAYRVVGFDIDSLA